MPDPINKYGYSWDPNNPHDVCDGEGHDFEPKEPDNGCDYCTKCGLGYFTWCFRRTRPVMPVHEGPKAKAHA